MKTELKKIQVENRKVWQWRVKQGREILAGGWCATKKDAANDAAVWLRAYQTINPLKPNRMKTHEVTVAVTVQAYATIKVPAESAEKAAAIVNQNFEDLGWNSPYWNRVEFKPDWQGAEDFRVLEPA